MPLEAEVKEKLAEIIAQAEGGGHVQAMSKLFNYLKSKSLMYSHRILPKMMLIHPANRDGIGCYPTEVHALLSDIADAGWSWQEIRAVAVEIDPNDTRIAAFNAGLVQQSNGLLPPLGSGKFASLSATHTNLVLRLFDANWTSEDTRFVTNGKLSSQKLKEHDVEFHDAVTNGLTWDILSSQVLDEFPQLAGLIQLTCNTSAQLMRRETELQLAKRIHATWLKIVKVKPSVSFQDVKTDLLRSKPPCQESLANLFKFVLQYGGGMDPVYLTETIKNCSSLTPKVLGPAFWESVTFQPRSLAIVITCDESLSWLKLVVAGFGIAYLLHFLLMASNPKVELQHLWASDMLSSIQPCLSMKKF